jgi:hypothetical protein
LVTGIQRGLISTGLQGVKYFWNSVRFRGSVFKSPIPEGPLPTLKNPQIMALDRYEGTLPQSFWDTFPANPLPSSPKSAISIQALSKILGARSPFLKISEIERAKRSILYLSEGAPSHQKVWLPATVVGNSHSAYENGRHLSDTIAEWVKSGFVAGPFLQPPTPHFRANCSECVSAIRGFFQRCCR